ncbi:hypothetical protein DYBT9275_05970 [Dyadobacter sp. CECT 9275]|uniref:Uncharacterized protein n=1 Tax=Dyadobacter helix TaxID=2822344 RepID=A0A916JIR3_9BACT|nr:hypothetical protein DYBT9275_05970 [Dyadobacter sp. CECT 9275]
MRFNPLGDNSYVEDPNEKNIIEVSPCISHSYKNKTTDHQRNTKNILH